ncbi:MAG TPA: DUF1289 domain-containing protein [Burkholderiales bacterium]
MTASEPPSPCIRDCTLDPRTDICLGCHRTLAEISAWANASNEEKRRILESAEERRRADVRKRRTRHSGGNAPPGA